MTGDYETIEARAIIALREASKRIYETFEGGCGGYLHIILDDGNMRDSDLEFCEQDAREHMAQIAPELFADYMICLTLLRLFPDEDSRIEAVGYPWEEDEY